MARLTTAERNALPDSAFAGPNRSYPVKKLNPQGQLVPDPSHAANAKSRAAGTGRKNLSTRMKELIDSKANAVLGGQQ